MLKPRVTRAQALLVAICFVAWMAWQWFDHRADFDWWSVVGFSLLFGLLFVVAAIKTAITSYVDERARRDAGK